MENIRRSMFNVCLLSKRSTFIAQCIEEYLFWNLVCHHFCCMPVKFNWFTSEYENKFSPLRADLSPFKIFVFKDGKLNTLLVNYLDAHKILKKCMYVVYTEQHAQSLSTSLWNFQCRARLKATNMSWLVV